MNNFELENGRRDTLIPCVFSSKLSSAVAPVSLLKSTTRLLKVSVLALLAISLFISVNAQAQWTKMSLAATNVQSFAIDPLNNNNMLAGTACISPINISGNLQCSAATGLYRSTNAGVRWVQVNDVNLKNGINSVDYSTDNTATQNIFVSVEGKGVFRSTNGGVSWTAAHIKPSNNPNVILTKNITQIIVTNKISSTQAVYALVKSSSEYQSAGGIYVTTNNGVSWNQIYIGDNILKLVVAKNAPSTLYVSVTSGEILKATNVNTGVNTVVNFASATSGLPAVVADFMIDPINSGYLYASAFGSGVQGFYRTTNGGSRWTVESSQNLFSKIAVDSKVSPPKFYGADDVSTGGAASRIHVLSSTDRMMWQKSDNNHLGFSSQQINTLVANNGVVYAGIDDGLYQNIESTTGSTTALNVSLTAQATSTTTVGGDINYTLTLQNTSTMVDAGSFTVTSSTAFPLNTIKVSDSPLNSCTIDTNRRVSCSVTGLNRGQSKVISFRVTLPSVLSQAQVAMSFTANVTADTNSFDNSNIATTTTISGGANATVPLVTSNARTVVAGSVAATYSFSATPVNSTDQLTYIIVSGGSGLTNSLGTVLFTNPSVGNAQQSLSPSFTFTPKANVSGREIISFKVRDNLGRESIIGNYVFTVNLPGNGSTTGNNGNATVPLVTSNAKTVVAGSVVGTYSFSATPVSSTDQLTYIIVSGGTGLANSLGTVLFTSPSAGNAKQSLNPSFTFRPKANVSGREIIRFKVRDNSGRESLTANYIFTVTLPGSSSTSGNINNGSIASNSGGAVSPLMLGLLGLIFVVRGFTFFARKHKE